MLPTMDKPGTMVVSERPAGKPVLREGYYLDNFLTLIAFVVSRYADILNEYEMDFVRRFGKLSISAKRLYVRLITRTGPVFRKDKIRYAEIGNVDDAIRELADDGFEGLMKAKTHKYDIIFMDLIMPEMDGFEASRKILEFDSSLMIVAFTADNLPESKRRAELSGIRDFISKPVRIDDLKKFFSRYFIRD